MELLVEVDLKVLAKTPATEFERRKRAWKRRHAPGWRTRAILSPLADSADGPGQGDRPDPRLTRAYRLEAAVRSGGG